MKKRMLVLLLVLSLLCVMLAGCGSSSSSDDTDTAEEAAESSETTEAEEETTSSETEEEAAEETEEETEETADSIYPLVDESVTLTMFATATPQVTNVIEELNNHQGYIEAEAITGVTIDIQTVSSDSGTDQLTLLVAAGDYPDLFQVSTFTNGDLDAYENEVIIDLTDYLEEYAPNYYALINTTEDIARNVATDEGYHLAFYRMYQENGGYENCSVTQGLMIRQDLLDDAGMEAPTTIDEMTELLEVFTNEYGLSDAVLLQGSITTMGDSFISAFGIGSEFYVVDGVAHYGPLEDEFKEYLKLLNEWYEAGYLNVDFYGYSSNPNDDTIVGKITSYDGVGIYFDSASNMETRSESADEGVTYVGMANLEGPDGENHFGLDAAIVKGACYYVSAQCSNIELAVQWCDFWYSDEGILLTNYGIEDVSFTYDEDGNPQWTDLIVNNPDGLSQSVCRQVYLLYTRHGICINDNEVEMLSETAQEAVAIWTSSSDRAYLFPSVSYTTDESTTRATLLNDITTLNDEALMEMVVGREDIDTYWEEYQQQLIDLGIEEVMQITQDALDRYYDR